MERTTPFRMETCEKISTRLYTLKDNVVRVLALISGFVIQIPCHYLLEDGTYVKLDTVQVEFEKLIRDNLEGDHVASKLDHISVISASFKKTAEDVEECMHTIKDGDKELKRRIIIVDSVKVPEDRVIDEFLVEMLDRDDLE